LFVNFRCEAFGCLFLQEKDFWKTELKEFSSKNGYDLNRNRDSPLLLDVLEGFLKLEVFQSVFFMIFFFQPLFHFVLIKVLDHGSSTRLGLGGIFGS